MCVPQYMSGGQRRTTLWNWFSPTFIYMVSGDGIWVSRLVQQVPLPAKPSHQPVFIRYLLLSIFDDCKLLLFFCVCWRSDPGLLMWLSTCSTTKLHLNLSILNSSASRVFLTCYYFDFVIVLKSEFSLLALPGL